MIGIMTQTTKEKIAFIIVLALLMLFALLTGCSLFGGSSVKPSTELETDIETALKNQEDFELRLSEISGQVEINKTNISTITTTVTNISKQETNTVEVNEPLSKYLLYFLIFVVVMRVISAWHQDGNTWKMGSIWTFIKNIF